MLITSKIKTEELITLTLFGMLLTGKKLNNFLILKMSLSFFFKTGFDNQKSKPVLIIRFYKIPVSTKHVLQYKSTCLKKIEFTSEFNLY
jgi:hypothetical protein